MGSLFWGLLIIIVGVSLIIKVIFNVDFPIFKIVFAFIFIYLGIRILIGGNFLKHEDGNNYIFTEGNVTATQSDNHEYNCVFGKLTLDLRDYEIKDGKNRVELNAVFGGAEVIIDSTVPIRIKAETVFGGVNLPENRDIGGFGSTEYRSDNYSSEKDYIYLKATSVFGGIKIKKVDSIE